MAKALVGHIATDHHLRLELTSLRAKVAKLESELEQLKLLVAADSVYASAAVDTPPRVIESLESELVEIRDATPALA